MTTRYVSRQSGTSLVTWGDSLITELLWGDPCRVIAENGPWVNVHARGRKGWVRKSHLGTQGLLEIYVIDVGQGDGVLMRTPDDKWHLIDAGVPNSRQMTKKGAANFLRWKFLSDLGLPSVQLASLIASHPDYDHYGGMLDLLKGKLYDGRTFPVQVDTFYHSGMGRFDSGAKLGKTTSGTLAAPIPIPGQGVGQTGRFIHELLGDLASFASPPRTLAGSFKTLAGLIASKCNAAQRLSTADGHLPGYSTGSTKIKVLGPVVEQLTNGKSGLRVLPSESKTRNGHSVVLRVDYGRCRILLTGDLNEDSQRLLLSYVPKAEYSSDVAKGCHHGSEDILVDFIKAMMAKATVISSGDNESYAHPRPVIMGASGRYGRESKTPGGTKMAPLVYSTELARSVNLAYGKGVRVATGSSTTADYTASKSQIKVGTGDFRALRRAPVAKDLIYGLVNVRTDGKTILCATMKETGKSFDKKLFMA